MGRRADNLLLGRTRKLLLRAEAAGEGFSGFKPGFVV